MRDYKHLHAPVQPSPMTVRDLLIDVVTGVGVALVGGGFATLVFMWLSA